MEQQKKFSKKSALKLPEFHEIKYPRQSQRKSLKELLEQFKKKIMNKFPKWLTPVKISTGIADEVARKKTVDKFTPKGIVEAVLK